MSGQAESDLSDPHTTAARLAEIAAVRPDLAEQIARHPNVYPELASWAQQTIALRVPVATEEPAATRTAPVRGKFVEPTRVQSPNGYTARYGIGLALILLGYYILSTYWELAIAGFFYDLWNSAFGDVWFMIPGFMIGAGLIVLPGALVRRVTASVVVGVLSVFADGAHLGGRGDWLLGRPLPAVLVLVLVAGGVVALWLFVRQRAGLTYILVIGPLLLAPIAILLGEWLWSSYWRGGAEALYYVLNALGPLSYLSLIAIPAWVARLWDPVIGRRRAVRAKHLAEQRANLTQPSASQAAGVAYPKTNTYATLALIFAFFVSVLGIVFGHLARSQIRQSGEPGWGVATAGLVIGYVNLALGAAIAIAYFVLVLSFF